MLKKREKRGTGVTYFSYVGSVAVLIFQLLLLMGVGLVCGKIRWLEDAGVKQITNLLFYVVVFCVIVESFLTVPFSPEKLGYMGAAAAACGATSLLGGLAAACLFRKQPPSRRAVYRFGTVFSNCGFMALPLVDALLGAEGVFVVSIYVAVFQIIMWTYGVSLYGYFDRKNALRQVLTNPGVLSVAVGLPLFLLRVSCPAVLLAPVSMLADLNTPVAMIVTGYYLGQTALRLQKGDGLILLVSLLRLVVIPLLLLGAMVAAGLRGFLLVACITPACAPSASNTSLFAVKFGADSVCASRLVSVCMVLSVITMPAIIALAQIIP